MSEVENSYVKRGFWINVEDGQAMGSTITTDVRNGTIIIALLAVLSTLAINNLWSVIVFAYHQLRSGNHSSADGLFRQQQVLLRASPQPTSFLADWLKLWWVWRKRISSASIRSAPGAVFALLFTAATIATGIFSSYVVSNTGL